MYSARNSGMKREMFGYVRGGYARVLERFGEVLLDKGVEIRLNSRVESIERLASGKVRISTKAARRNGDVKPNIVRQPTKYANFQAAAAVAPGFSGAFIAEPQMNIGAVVRFPDDRSVTEYDRVIMTCPSNTAEKVLEGLDPVERRKLRSIRYQGIVCASVMLKRSLSDYYVTNITDDTPFTGIIEMSRSSIKKNSTVTRSSTCRGISRLTTSCLTGPTTRSRSISSTRLGRCIRTLTVRTSLPSRSLVFVRSSRSRSLIIRHGWLK
ncbi:MAG: FAD-dependent oxidoreductase [Chloracidobacterium sp.]|nr:FAD-dependent oxidoreductase [Chloracidobacterium sp.]